jgi:hypothetical protein
MVYAKTWLIMVHSPHCGQLADGVGIHPATLTGVIDRLERGGWIMRDGVIRRMTHRFPCLRAHIQQLQGATAAGRENPLNRGPSGGPLITDGSNITARRHHM